MDTLDHNLNAPFAQLGLADTDEAIDRFIGAHQGMDRAIPLADAPFWTDAQAAFLRQAIAEDADWADRQVVSSGRIARNAPERWFSPDDKPNPQATSATAGFSPAQDTTRPVQFAASRF